MTIQEFEQAKKEFAAKWQYGNVSFEDEFMSDLTALLKQHKEMMKEELRQKLFSMRATKKAMDKLSKDDKLMQYGYHDCINEILMWTKSREK